VSSLLEVVPGPAFVPLDPDLEMVRVAKKYLRGVPSCMKYVTPVPWIFDLLVDVVRPAVFHAPGPVVQLIPWVTALESSCRYCYGAQRGLLRVLGHKDDWIERVERDVQLADVDEAQRGVIQLARKLSRSNPRPARADRDALARRFGDAAAVEIAFVVAGWCFATRVATFLRLPPDREMEQLSKRWFVPLLRPVFRIMSRQPPRRPEIVPLRGPFQDVLTGMGDVPAVHLIRRTIDRALASPALPRRAKLLVIAVVARSMPCAATEAEATRLLADEGLGADDVAEILKNLGSPKLDPLESLLVPFARGSVRYEFLEVQDRVERELAPKLSRDQLIEAVGIAALANSVVRLAMLSV
jgi:alkylhydroperoxidase family enzyme